MEPEMQLQVASTPVISGLPDQQQLLVNWQLCQAQIVQWKQLEAIIQQQKAQWMQQAEHLRQQLPVACSGSGGLQALCSAAVVVAGQHHASTEAATAAATAGQPLPVNPTAMQSNGTIGCKPAARRKKNQQQHSRADAAEVAGAAASAAATTAASNTVAAAEVTTTAPPASDVPGSTTNADSPDDSDARATKRSKQSKHNYNSELLAYGQHIADIAIASTAATPSALAVHLQLMAPIEAHMIETNAAAFGGPIDRQFRAALDLQGPRKEARRGSAGSSRSGDSSSTADEEAAGSNADKPMLSYEQLEKLFQSTTMKGAADSLGIGLTKMKQLCRDAGIQRWPYRDFKGIDNALTHLKQKPDAAKDKLLLPGRKLLLQHAHALLLQHPNMMFELHPASSLFEALHKQKHKQKKAEERRAHAPGDSPDSEHQLEYRAAVATAAAAAADWQQHLQQQQQQ